MSAAISDSVHERVQGVFTKVFANQLAFHPDLQRAGEARWTSLKHVEFLVGLEREFGIRFDGSDAMEMNSINAVVQILEQRRR